MTGRTVTQIDQLIIVGLIAMGVLAIVGSVTLFVVESNEPGAAVLGFAATICAGLLGYIGAHRDPGE